MLCVQLKLVPLCDIYIFLDRNTINLYIPFINQKLHAHLFPSGICTVNFAVLQSRDEK